MWTILLWVVGAAVYVTVGAGTFGYVAGLDEYTERQRDWLDSPLPLLCAVSWPLAVPMLIAGPWLRKLAGRLAVAGKARRLRVEAVTKAAHIAECARQSELQDLEDELAKDAAEA